MVKRGLPAVVVCTEQFRALAKTIMRAQSVPESIGILLNGNPEYIDEAALLKVVDEVAAAAMERLTRSTSNLSHTL